VERYANSGSFTAAQAEAVIAQANFDRVTKRGDVDYVDLLAFQQSHFQEPLNEAVIPADVVDGGLLTNLQLIQGRHAYRILGIKQLRGNWKRPDQNVHARLIAQT
jgi:hypothetical protein